MTIRRAEAKDIARINALLYQVAELHAKGRPDLFRPASKKYSDEELLALLACDSTPIFVAADEGDTVQGYAFCIEQITAGHPLMQDKRTLYIDDICVDERMRGRRIGRALYEHVTSYARACGFDNLTLNVWAFNEGAYAFYQACGMTPQKTVMEKTL